ncbi:hypothetical protein [Kurthia gibsonii]|uniref:hypothetical protein n=1 Tax=Kurthia gibsonii TaxID=33946 RepID=UPI0030165B9C
MKKIKAKVIAQVEMIVWITEDAVGNQEIEDVEEVTDIEEFEITNEIDRVIY